MQKETAKVNPEQCARVAAITGKLKLRNDFYQREYLQMFTDRETLLGMHFFAVAICHQTHQLYHPVLKLFGWDYLEHVFTKLAKENSEILRPGFLAGLEHEVLISRLKHEFSYDGNPENCSLDRLDERAFLMTESSKRIVDEFDGSLNKLLKKSDGLLLNKGQGLYELFPRFSAFSDPLQKKSTFFVKLLMEAGLIEIGDTENFIPIMDYHMQRVLLRLGCVEIVDVDYRQKIVKQSVLPTDEPIRSLCVEAFRLIADDSGHQITKMNDFFWSLARSCCHKTTLCCNHVCEKSPCTFTQIVEVTNHDRCAFQDVCPGAIREEYRELWQPVVETHFY